MLSHFLIMKKNKSRSKLGDKIASYIQASRIEGGIVAAIFLLIGEWYSIQNFPPHESIIALLATIGIVNSGSLINYVFDVDTDKTAGKDVKFFSHVSIREMTLFALLVSLISLLLLLYINFFVFITGIMIFVIFFIYAAPPIRLKTIPPFDCIANSLGFGILPFFLGWLITDTPKISMNVIYGGTVVGLVVVSYYLFIGIFDIETDKEAGIKNSCTFLGFNRAIYVGIIFFFVSLVLSMLFFGMDSLIPIVLLVCSPIAVIMIIKHDPISVRMLASIFYLIYTGTSLFLLSVLSKSTITVFLFIIVLLISIQVILIYMKK